jgi:hypothetical protein
MYFHQALQHTVAAPRGRGVWVCRLVHLAVIITALLTPVNAPEAQQRAHLGAQTAVADKTCAGSSQTPIPAGTFTQEKSGLELYDKIVADAQRCAPEEKCAVAGGVQGCRCPVAVRASAKQVVDKAAGEASCEQVERLYCPPLKNPRCQKQACIADQVRE